ncbi:MAG: tRNA uridine-5-carboxymethylaminomethyl(34) synthesis enzyme MnmG [Bacteriovoracaceae bacterium]|nr:tRNA uridine-5-carboxymethylaminomethyl(34) synthesis enzyme MnmG [Bacteriovoracaceae bacterium]
MIKFDIIVLGGGHAGLESACISAQLGLKVGLLTLPNVPIASAPCNPAIGGVGKGQVVREIDALGGVMGILADKAGIQYRTLNESKGHAVRSTRVQIDKDLYPLYAEELVKSYPNIMVIRAKAQKVQKIGDIFTLHTEEESYSAQKVIVTTGTFLGARCHLGEKQIVAGRHNCETSNGISSLFDKVESLPVRFKTGTPARLRKSSIDFSQMEEQASDPFVRNFHILNSPYARNSKQVSCYMTHTNAQVMQIIRDNKEKSPMFNGQIKAVGVRYCPSIEDKAFRYPDRHSHHVFIEPEGLNQESIYPNGISTSLPESIQKEFINKISGLENAEILIAGYAVEYDVVNTAKLSQTLEYTDISGLYFAGQCNGTSGYEEAAGQGLIAGINASFSLLGRGEFILDRHESYIGVMVEDLVSDERDEPYRLFTARSEDRLFLREDNTLIRMAPYRKQLQLDLSLDHFYQEFLKQYDWILSFSSKVFFYGDTETKEYFQAQNYGPLEERLSLKELIQRISLDPAQILQKELERLGFSFNLDVLKAAGTAIKYEGYIKRSDMENNRLRKMDSTEIDWEEIIKSSNVSFECRQRIEKIRPKTFGQLRRMQGIRPATLAVVAGRIY